MYSSFLGTINFALSITAPIFLLVLMGILLKKYQSINDNFIHTASKLVFNFGLPTLLFITITKTRHDNLINLDLLLVGLTGTLLFFLLSLVVSRLFVSNRRDRGVVIQGSFRGNLGIVGLAFSINAFGDAGLATASLYMAILTILYNVLSVFILTQSLNTQSHNIAKTIALNILKNPIIISICAALGFVYLDMTLHPILLDSGEYISALTLPLALICIGGSISLRELKHSSLISFVAVCMKLVVAPTAMVAFAMLFDFNRVELGVIFLMAAAPTATASYIMVQAMNGNGILAANIVVLSTLASVVSASIGIAILRHFGMI